MPKLNATRPRLRWEILAALALKAALLTVIYYLFFSTPIADGLDGAATARAVVGAAAQEGTR